MRGTFDFNEELYPVNVAFAGVNSVIVVNHLSGEELVREELAGPYQSEARKEQFARLEAQAVKANQDIRASAVLPTGETFKPQGALLF